MHFKKSLRRRFIFTLIGVVTIILAIFSGVVIGYNYTKKEAELQQQLQRTLGITQHTVKGRLHRARKQLADILKEQGIYDEG